MAHQFSAFTPSHTTVSSGASMFCYYKEGQVQSLPLILLLHGYPQSHLMWKEFVKEIPSSYSILIPDLPGYGGSAKQPSLDGSAFSHSKKAWAKDILDLIDSVCPSGSTPRKIIALGHDRGAQVAYRMALDFSSRVAGLAVLCIVPTVFAWERMRIDVGLHAVTRDYSHWLLLSSAAPLPETLISAQPQFYFTNFLNTMSPSNPPSSTLPEWKIDAIAPYLDPTWGYSRLVAACVDHRAAADHDLLFDLDSGVFPQNCSILADKKPGRPFTQPLLVVSTVSANVYNDYKRIWSGLHKNPDQVTCHELRSGHFIVNEATEDLGAKTRDWLKRYWNM